MDKQINKRSFLEVYSSEEEEVADVNKLQEEFKVENTPSEENMNSENSESANFDDVALKLEIGFTFINDNM